MGEVRKYLEAGEYRNREDFGDQSLMSAEKAVEYLLSRLEQRGAQLAAVQQQLNERLDFLMSVNQALHAVNCEWRIDRHDSGQAIAVRTPEVHSELMTATRVESAELLALRQQLGQAEQRIEEAFRAGYHCRWHKEVGAYCFDPTLSPGDPEGAFAAWLAARLPAPHGCPPEKETP